MTNERSETYLESLGIKDTLATVERDLKGLEQGPTHPMTQEAFHLLLRNVSGYVNDLVNESLRLAARGEADNVSAKHVERAASYLSISTSRDRRRYLGTLGGLLLGAGISSLVSMVQVSSFSMGQVLLTCALIGVGGAMVAIPKN